MSDPLLSDNLYDTADETSPEEPVYDAEPVDEPIEITPKPHTPRVSGADFITLLWGGLGTFLVQSGADVPVGRVLRFQAPMVGERIDQILAETWLDSVLQPVFRTSETAQELGAIVGLPAMIALYERNTELGVMLEPFIREAVGVTLEEMAPIVRARMAKRRRSARSMSDLNEIFDLPRGADPVDAVLSSFFAGPPGTEPAPPEGDQPQ